MNKNLEYIAYDGKSFTIEWHFDLNNKSQSLNEDERIKILKLFKRMGDSGEIKDKTKFIYEGDKVYAFKPQPNRFLCFFYNDKKIIVTNAFKKKQQRIPKNEKDKALKKREAYTTRIKKGEYYE